VVVILWIYYSSQILLLGAEVTSVLDGKRRDAREQAAANAERTGIATPAAADQARPEAAAGRPTRWRALR
jgi:uncharacterized BrkB/YihY/UPF0761 family membrane protein